MGQAIQPDRESDDVLTMEEIRRVRRLAMTAVRDVAPHPDAGPDEGPGSFRTHDIHPFPAGMVPPSHVLVSAEMRAWLDRAQHLDATDPCFAEEVASLHCRFEQIHPFVDGNGRTGRLVLNLLLVRSGFPPAIIYKNQRTAYLAALRRADEGEVGQLAELIARAILDNLYKFVVPAVAGPARLVPLAALATEEVKAGALRAAAVRGVLQASKGSDGQWRSSKNWVEEYTGNRHKRRRPELRSCRRRSPCPGSR